MSTLAQISVIIPVYNRTVYLGLTVESVLDQSYRSWELWIVDDGSQEDVQGFVSRYPDARIHFVRQSNQGNAAARNHGIRQAQGEYVICLDSDDIWHPAILETCVTFLAAHPDVDVAYTQVQSIDSEGRPLPQPVGPAPQGSDLLEPLLMGYPILPSSALIRRSCFQRWGPYTPGMDDWEMWLRWAARGCRFACIEQALLYYRIHNQNLNLAYDSRRAVHLAMLDRFYDGDHSPNERSPQESVPKAARRLRERAYANQHFLFAVLAWQAGRAADGMAEFAAAALDYPPYLSDLDFYTRIACAHQGRTDAGTGRGLSLGVAEATLTECLAALFGRSNLPLDISTRRGAAYGWAYMALAQLAYGVAQDMVQARRWLWRALVAWPALAWQSEWAVWLARSALGYRWLQAAKAVLHRRLDHA